MDAELEAALERWARSLGASAEVPAVELTLGPDARSGRVVHLYESAAVELRTLLELDAVARLGHETIEATADELVLSALRLRYLHRQSSESSRRAEHPRLRSRAAAALRRLVRAASELTVGGPSFFTDHRAAAAERDSRMLDHYNRLLGELAELEADLLPRTSGIGASHDAFTLADQFLLVACPGAYASVWHVRVFRPADQPPVVVIGDLVDYHSPGALEEPKRVFVDVARRMPLLAQESPRWLHYLPSEYVRHSERTTIALEHESALPSADSLRLVQAMPDGKEFEMAELSFEEAQTMVSGPIRRWHAADFNSAVLTGFGLRTVDAVALPSSRTTHPETRILLRCRRWWCGVAFDRPLRTLTSACCPRCGSTAMQPIRVEHA
jgi:hypothetical protein